MVGHERKTEQQGSASSFNQLERRMKKDMREVSVKTLLVLNAGMLSLTHKCDSLP